MAHYRIAESDRTVSIEVSETDGHQDHLLEAFAECQAGRCSCPTEEYQKLAAMDVRQTDHSIQLRLEAKPGERFDTAEIAVCLDHVTRELTATPPEN